MQVNLLANCIGGTFLGSEADLFLRESTIVKMDQITHAMVNNNNNNNNICKYMYVICKLSNYLPFNI